MRWTTARFVPDGPSGQAGDETPAAFAGVGAMREYQACHAPALRQMYGIAERATRFRPIGVEALRRDELGRGTRQLERRLQLAGDNLRKAFDKHRALIEHIASEKFDAKKIESSGEVDAPWPWVCFSWPDGA